MTLMAMRPRATNFFLQLLGLVAVALIAAQVVGFIMTFVVTWRPPTYVYHVSDVVQVLKSGQPLTQSEGGPPLVRRKVKHAPQGAPDTRRRAMFKISLAQALGVDPQHIAIWTDASIFNRAPVLTDRNAVPPDNRGGGPRPDFGNGARPDFRAGGPDRDEPFLTAPFRVAIPQADGTFFVIQTNDGLTLSDWRVRIAFINLLAALLVAPLAWWFARRVANPVTALGAAAERLGRDPNAPPLELRGSSEVKAAAAAFNGMQERLRAYVEDRTAMVGAIAHDLRTPLTRLRFRIEAAPEEVRAKLAADIDQMDEMISATLAFVRDATQTGERQPLELSSLLESVLEDAADTGARASMEPSEKVVIEGDSLALKRMVANLVENAIKYGGSARGRLHAEDGCAVLEIEDDGPGVPAGEAERMFEPFYRHERSRNRQTGGIGLGLAVVRSIARAHGGDVTLHNRPEGGLTARARLPV